MIKQPIVLYAPYELMNTISITNAFNLAFV